MANKYSGTQTEKNLEAAFAGESQARNKYTYFASKAKKEGFEQIAAIFQHTADNEKEHAKLWFKELEGIGSTAENLAAAAAGENIHQLAGHLSFKPGTGQQANVVDKARNGDDQQHLPLRQKVVRHPVRVKCLMLHGFPPAPAVLPHPGSPPFSGLCSFGRACPEWRRIA